MMQAIRSRAGSIIVKVLFGLLIISFGFWGIYTRSPFSDSRSPDTTVATVGEQNISAGELQQALQPTLERLRAQLGTAIDSQQMKQLGIVDGTLTQLIDRSLLDQEARRLGLAASTTLIRNTIFENPAFRAPNGQFDRQRFEEVLTANRMTEPQLVERLRRDIPRTDLLQAITAGVGVPRPVVDAIYRYRNEKRIADIVAFPAAGVATVGQPTEAELTKFYDAHKELFRAPEYRGFTVASLTPAEVEKTVTVSEDKLKQAWEQRRDEFQIPEQREIQQILAPSEAKAKEAEAALKSGQNWQAVATKIAGQSADTIDLGLLSAKEIPHELGDVAFKLPLNQPSQPIKSPLGWHILRIVKIVPASSETFAQAKPKLEAQLKLQEAVNRVDKVGNEADDALAGGATLTEAAKKYGLTLTTVTAAENAGKDRAGKPVALPVSATDVLKTAFSTNQGDTSRITDTNDGSVYAVHVEKIMPPAVRPLAEVKNKAVADWQAEQKREAAIKESKALAAAVKPGAALAAAAGTGVSVLSGVTLSRSGEPPKSMPPELVQKLFAAKPGAVVTASDATGAFTAQLKQVNVPQKIPEAAAQGLSDQLTDAAKVDVAGQFAAALRQKFPVDIKHEAVGHLF